MLAEPRARCSTHWSRRASSCGWGRTERSGSDSSRSSARMPASACARTSKLSWGESPRASDGASLQGHFSAACDYGRRERRRSMTLLHYNTDPRRVLLVGEDRLSLRVLGSLLAEHGFEIVGDAVTEHSALELLGER